MTQTTNNPHPYNTKTTRQLIRVAFWGLLIGVCIAFLPDISWDISWATPALGVIGVLAVYIVGPICAALQIPIIFCKLGKFGAFANWSWLKVLSPIWITLFLLWLHVDLVAKGFSSLQQLNTNHELRQLEQQLNALKNLR